MVQIRDIVIRRQKEADKKADAPYRYRAVLTDITGAQASTNPLVDVWANQTEKLVYHVPYGAGSPAPIYCYIISDPYVGLPVFCGYRDGSDEIEVLRVDPLPAKVGGNPSGYDSTSPEDLEPGGKKMMWTYPKTITPLATYPNLTGLLVNVIAGDYVYGGVRVSFDGQNSIALTQNPNPGEHYFAGLYLDSANALQVVYGASITTASEPPEPAWPAGAFRLSVVRVNDTQTSITFAADTDTANDVLDRRMPWSDENGPAAGGGNVWPKAGENLLEGVNYSTVALLIAAMSAGKIAYLGGRSSSEAVDVNVADITLQGVSRLATIFTALFTVSAVTTRSRIEDLGVVVAGSGAQAINTTDGPVDFVDVKAQHTGVEDARGFQLEADARLFDCESIATSDGTGLSPTARAVYVTNSATVEIHGGNFRATIGTADEIFVDAGASVLLDGPTLTFGNFGGAGDIFGWWLDSAGNVYLAPGSDLHLGSGSGITSGVMLEDISTGLSIYYPTFALANAAAAAGDTIIISQSGSYACAGETLAAGVNLCILPGVLLTGTSQYTLTLAGGNRLFGGGKVEKTDSTAVQAAAVRVTGNDCIVDDIDGVCINSHGSGFGFGFYQTDETGIELRNCRWDATGTTGDSYGYRKDTSAGGTAKLIGGRYAGTTGSVYNDQTGAVTLFDPILVGAVSGIVPGGYFDTAGLDYPRSAFHAHKNGTNQTGIVTATFTKLTSTTESFDLGGDYDAANSKHLPLTPGYYMYTATAMWSNTTDQARLILAIYKNGAEVKHAELNASGTTLQMNTVVAFIQMNGTTDYIEFYVWQNTGSDRIVTGNVETTYIEGSLLWRS